MSVTNSDTTFTHVGAHMYTTENGRGVLSKASLERYLPTILVNEVAFTVSTLFCNNKRPKGAKGQKKTLL